ncbi:MAG: hypothetical protein HN931_14115 [Desulfobacterales bacterium]|nr:hypothetical protein [Desulfobacterales bacterium]
MTKNIENKKVTLDEIFYPRGVAVIGVSPSKMTFSEMVVLTLIQAGFPNIYPVNPKYKETFDLPCYPNLQSIPEVVDHVLVNIPAESVLALLDDCIEKGIKSIQFFTAGFGESGIKERIDLEKEMLRKAREGNFRIIGPNCVGLCVTKTGLNQGFSYVKIPGSVAFISQSGGNAFSFPFRGGLRGIYFSKIVSYGNAIDVDEVELIEYLTDDPDTEIISAYIEGVKDGSRFKKAFKEAASKKPFVIYKGGKTEAGKRAAHGHTASMTSSVAIFEGLCRQVNAIQVDDVEEMADVIAALSYAKPLPKDTGAALIGAGGGPSVLAGDVMEKEGLYLPAFSKELQEELKQVLPVAGSIFINPLDTTNLATPEAIEVALNVLANAEDIHMVAYHLGFHPIGTWGIGRYTPENFCNPVIESMKKFRETSGKPVLLALQPPLDMGGMEEFLASQAAFVEAGFPVFHSIGRLARAMARTIKWNNRI